MKLRVLIADDEPPSRQRLRQLLEADPNAEIVAECADGMEAVRAIRQVTPDLAFLDVKMPELDGFGVLEALNGARLPAIVFVTAYDQFAVRAFEVHAVDYLLKPFDHERFQLALQRARERLEHGPPIQNDPSLTGLLATVEARLNHSERLTIKSGGRITFLKLAEIDWISSADNYAELRVGNATHLLRRTLTALASQLPPNRFVRISRSVLVNLDRIKEIQSRSHGDYLILLHDGTRLSGSRNYRDNLATLLGRLR